MADCGVIPDPTAEQLADIALSTAWLARHMLGVRPRVAMLSFSTKGSSAHASAGKVQAATALARHKAEQRRVEADFDGELQVDAALDPEIAGRKLQESKVAGRANVLIFPDLNSGNIASKLMRFVGPRQRLRPDFARAEPARGGCLARFERARHSRRGRNRRRDGRQLSKPSTRKRTRNCPENERWKISNIQHLTSNAERRGAFRFIGCSMLNVESSEL